MFEYDGGGSRRHGQTIIYFVIVNIQQIKFVYEVYTLSSIILHYLYKNKSSVYNSTLVITPVVNHRNKNKIIKPHMIILITGLFMLMFSFFKHHHMYQVEL